MAPSGEPVSPLAATPEPRRLPGARIGDLPACEEGMLVTASVERDLPVFGSTVRLAKVQVDECPQCGYRALSAGRPVCSKVVFARHYERVADLVQALRDARYLGMFLKEDRGATALGFGHVTTWKGWRRTSRICTWTTRAATCWVASAGARGTVRVEVGGRTYGVRLPKMGEGENGVVFRLRGEPERRPQLAKPREYSRATSGTSARSRASSCDRACRCQRCWRTTATAATA